MPGEPRAYRIPAAWLLVVLSALALPALAPLVRKPVREVGENCCHLSWFERLVREPTTQSTAQLCNPQLLDSASAEPKRKLDLSSSVSSSFPFSIHRNPRRTLPGRLSRGREVRTSQHPVLKTQPRSLGAHYAWVGYCSLPLFGATVAGEICGGEATMTAPLVSPAATQYNLR